MRDARGFHLSDHLSFRHRIAAAAAVAVVLAVSAAAAVAYLALGSQLRAELDRSLADRLADFRRQVRIQEPFGSVQFPPPPLGGAGGFAQLVSAAGEVALPAGEPLALPVDERVLLVASGRGADFYRDVELGGARLRVLTARAAEGRTVAIMIARSLGETDRALARTRFFLLVTALVGMAGSAGLGLAVARAALRPVDRLARAAEQIGATGDLTQRVPAGQRDELGRLGARFNEMLAALEASQHAQRALVADASHELRTPLTSLRTNIEVLARGRVSPEERAQMLADITAQIAGLTRLVGDLIDLARGAEPDENREEVRLDELVARAVADAQRDHPGVRFTVRAEPVVVEAAPARIERALTNLIDNAAKYGAADAPVEVEVDHGGVTVRDHGPGFVEADLPRIFDRFYRGAGVRTVAGSGLGLAIAKQVADRHGWTIHAENADPGARISLEIPPG